MSKPSRFSHYHFHHHRRVPVFVSRMIWGGLFIIAGVLLIAFNMGFLPEMYKPIVFSWPTLLILVGLIQSIYHRRFSFGILLMGLGAYFGAARLGLGHLPEFGKLILPLILIFLGLRVAFRKRPNWHEDSACYRPWKDPVPDDIAHAQSIHEDGRLDENNVFSGSRRKFRNVVFLGGEINCVFGGSEIDLTEAQLAEGTTEIEVNCVFGGAVLIIPETWTVRLNTSSVFGEFVDRGRTNMQQRDPKRVLLIRGSCVFGGGEIKYG